MKTTKVALFLRVLFVVSLLGGSSDGAKILCVSHQFGSHLNMIHLTTENLIGHGHEVYTVFSDMMPVPQNVPDRGFKVIKYHTPVGRSIMNSGSRVQAVFEAIFGDGEVDHAGDSLLASGECYDMERDNKFMETLENHKFDLIVVDTFPICNCLYFIPLRLNVPFVLVSPAMLLEETRSPALPSFSPSPVLEMTDNMSFLERLQNTWLTVMISTPALTIFPAIRDTTLLKKYNKDPSITTWAQLGRKAELWFVHRGPVLEYIVPEMPHIINIECLSCKPGKPLPKDINKLADKSKGIIVVSFGSLVDRIPDHLCLKFLDAFEAREELVFWRYNGKLPRPVKDNVKVMKWLPQNDLLAHPKAKAFITHSGNNGQYESVYHGIPMLAFPLFAEQPHNSKRIVVKELGLRASMRKFTSEEISQKLTELIENPKYKKNCEKRSKILKNAPISAREKATYWIEHVLQFGSDHLRSHALEMTWYSYYMFDIMLFVEVIFIVFILVLVFVLKSIVGCILGKNNMKEKTN